MEKISLIAVIERKIVGQTKDGQTDTPNLELLFKFVGKS